MGLVIGITARTMYWTDSEIWPTAMLRLEPSPLHLRFSTANHFWWNYGFVFKQFHQARSLFIIVLTKNSTVVLPCAAIEQIHMIIQETNVSMKSLPRARNQYWYGYVQVYYLEKHAVFRIEIIFNCCTGTTSHLIEVLASITIYDRPRLGMITSINFQRLPAVSI